MEIEIHESEIFSEGDGVSDDSYLRLDGGLDRGYVFRAGDVYALRIGDMDQLEEAYEVSRFLPGGRVILLPIGIKKTLRKLRRSVLKLDEVDLPSSAGHKTPPVRATEGDPSPWRENAVRALEDQI